MHAVALQMTFPIPITFEYLRDLLVMSTQIPKASFFLEEIDFSMHFWPPSNKFTSVSYRGSATVDYCVVPTTVYLI